jgi:aquaporin NIP
MIVNGYASRWVNGARPNTARRAAAEALATFALVFAGCGAIVADARYGGALGAVGVGLVFGLIIMVMVYATGHLSGAHINPAVTVAFTLSRHFPARDAAVYVGAQLAGAVAGALVLLAIWPDQPAELGATVPSVGAGSAFVYELVLTAFLMFVIMAVATDTRAVGPAAAIAIGGTVGLDALFGGPVTGASMNPARSFAPALVAGEWSDFWLYVLGPLVGAALGAFAYQLVRGHAQPAPEEVAARV